MKWTFPLLLLLSLPVTGQNFLPNGDFVDGAAGWTNTRMTDPAGSTGFGAGMTTTYGMSKGVYMDFQTLSPVFYCNYVSNGFVIPPGTWNVSFHITWEKKVTTPIPSTSVNRVEFWILDATNTAVFTSGQIHAPNQTGLHERATFSGKVAIPTPSGQPPLYKVEFQARHSNLAQMPYTVWIDNIVVGQADFFTYGLSCPGTGGFEPYIQASGQPQLGSTNWTVALTRAYASTLSILVLGHSTTAWSGLPLPYDIGGGCSLHTGMTLMFPCPVTGSGPGQGTANLILPIPNDPILQGAMLFSQFLVRDTGSGSWSTLTATEGLAFKVQ